MPPELPTQHAPIPLRSISANHAQSETATAGALGNYPRPLTSLIGRDAEVATARALLVDDGVRLLTLTGPGGVGKTRLALRIGEDTAAAFPDGVVFVPLAAIADSELVLPAIAMALGLREADAQPCADRIADHLRQRRVLLVLDNVEQVLSAATQLAALLAACPDLVVLVTSRALLRIAGEQRFLVTPLALPDDGQKGAPGGSRPDGASVRNAIAASAAVQLFVARAQALDPNFTLDADNAAAIAAICHRLDGLPLAIELAAARIRVLAPSALLARLDPVLPLLGDGPTDAPDRLRTMRQAIAWSYDLLTEDEQTLFRRLALFVGGFTLEAAEDVGGREGGDSLDLVASLVDKSLLQLGQFDGWESRFAMLETVREFALERLVESGEAAAVTATHAAYVLRIAEQAEPVLMGPDERRWEARLDAELGNLRAALSWSLAHDCEMALRIGAALWRYWAWHHVAEGRRWLTAALAQPSLGASLVRARGLTTSAALAALEGDLAGGLASASAAIQLAREAGDRLAEGQARWIASCAHFVAGRVEAAAPELDLALPLLDLATTSTDRGWAAYARSNRGAMALMMGEHAHGFVLYEDALARARGVGTSGITLFILSDFAGWLIERGETSRARGMLEEALALAAEHRETWLVMATLISLALVAAAEDEAAVAARRLGAIEAMRFQEGLIMPEHYQRRIDRATEIAKSALGERSYTEAWTTGREDPATVVAEASGHLGYAAAHTDRDTHAESVELTPREREVLRLLVAGLSDKEIGAALGLGRRTAAYHVATIRAKLEAPSRTAAAAIAVRDGLV